MRRTIILLTLAVFVVTAVIIIVGCDNPPQHHVVPRPTGDGWFSYSENSRAKRGNGGWWINTNSYAEKSVKLEFFVPDPLERR